MASFWDLMAIVDGKLMEWGVLKLKVLKLKVIKLRE